MSEGFVMPLSGDEVLTDFLQQIEKKLRTDCNLRGNDAYSGGYSGEIKISLKLFAVDVAVVEMEFPVSGQTTEGDAKVLDEVNVEVELDVPREQNLDEVRDRAGLGKPMSVKDPETGQTTTKKRTYARPVAAGAALDENI